MNLNVNSDVFGGVSEKFKNDSILSGIFSIEGIKALDRFMIDLDIMVKYKLSLYPTKPTPEGTPKGVIM